MQDIQCQLTVSRGQFLADKRPLKKLTNFGFFFATLHFSTRSIKWTYLEEILAKFAYPNKGGLPLSSFLLVISFIFPFFVIHVLFSFFILPYIAKDHAEIIDSNKRV